MEKRRYIGYVQIFTIGKFLIDDYPVLVCACSCQYVCVSHRVFTKYVFRNMYNFNIYDTPSADWQLSYKRKAYGAAKRRHTHSPIHLRCFFYGGIEKIHEMGLNRKRA